MRKTCSRTPELDKLYQVLYLIQHTSNKNKKIQTLQSKLNEFPVLKDVCVYLCDLSDTSKWTINRLQEFITVKPQRRDLSTISSVLFYITYNQDCSDIDLANVNVFINDKLPILRKMIWAIICGSIDIGLTKDEIASAINYQRKVWRLPSPKPYRKEILQVNEYIYVFHNLKGMRCVWDGEVLRSSSGLIIKGLDYIISEIKSRNLSQYFIDGVLMSHNLPIEMPTHRLGDRSSGSLWTFTTPTLSFVIYDIVPLYGREKETLLYKQRYALRRELIGNDCVYISNAECLYEGTNHDIIDELLDTNHDLIIYRNVVCKFSAHNGILHAQKRTTAIAEIIGYTEGRGKYKNKLGVLIVLYDNQVLKIHTGFSSKERSLLWKQRDKLSDSKCVIELRKDNTYDNVQYATFIKLID